MERSIVEFADVAAPFDCDNRQANVPATRSCEISIGCPDVEFIAEAGDCELIPVVEGYVDWPIGADDVPSVDVTSDGAFAV